MARAKHMTADDRREHLLFAARAVFVQRGYHGAAVSHVIREAGVARGTFYNYFESKRAAFGAVLEQVIHEVLSSVKPIDVGRPIPQQVREMLVGIVGTVTERDVGRLLFAEAIGIDQEGDAAMTGFYRLAVAKVERALLDGQRMGIVRAGPVGMAACCVVGMAQMPLLMSVLTDEPVDAEALVNELYGQLTSGLLRVGA